jgi:hypothetical protein
LQCTDTRSGKMANVLPKPKKSIVLYTENYVYGGANGQRFLG